MAVGDVAVLLSEPTNSAVINATVADGTAIAKGSLCYWSGDNTVLKASSSAAAGMPFAGIAASEKVASDGSTTLGMATQGIYDIYCGAPVGLGNLVMLSGANTVCRLSGVDVISGGGIVGKALEAGDANEQIAVAIGCY